MQARPPQGRSDSKPDELMLSNPYWNTHSVSLWLVYSFYPQPWHATLNKTAFYQV